MIRYKFLAPGARGPVTGHPWAVPASDGRPGAWGDAARLPLVPCGRGWHVCGADDLSWWLDAELWEVEIGGERRDFPSGTVAERARLLARVENWPEPAAGAFA